MLQRIYRKRCCSKEVACDLPVKGEGKSAFQKIKGQGVSQGRLPVQCVRSFGFSPSLCILSCHLVLSCNLLGNVTTVLHQLCIYFLPHVVSLTVEELLMSFGLHTC